MMCSLMSRCTAEVQPYDDCTPLAVRRRPVFCSERRSASAQTPTRSSSSSTTIQLTRHGPRPQRSSATLACGMCRPAEVLPAGKWSASGYRRGTNYIQGFSNVGDFAGTFAYGVKDRAEIFGSFLFDTRIDRDLRPLFLSNDQKVGGVIDRYPRMNTTWSGDNVGDFYLGAKINFLSQFHQKPAAVAVRGDGQAADRRRRRRARRPARPTGSSTSSSARKRGSSRGVGLRAATSSAASRTGSSAPSGAFRWGAGVGVSVTQVRFAASFELNGLVPSSDAITHRRRSSSAPTGSIGPVHVGDREHHAGDRGAELAAQERLLPRRRRELERADAGPRRLWRRTAIRAEVSDYFDWQVRIGYHPGVRVVRAAATAAAPATTTAATTAAPPPTGRAEPSADGHGRVRAAVGPGGPELYADGDRAGSRRRHADLPLGGAGRHARATRPTARRSGPRRSRKAPCR